MSLTDEQRELYGTAYLRTYTDDVYVGPDIKSECLNQMVDDTLDHMVYLQPEEDSDTRGLVALLDDVDQMSKVCKYMVTICYAIGECVRGSSGKIAVKWVQLQA